MKLTARDIGLFMKQPDKQSQAVLLYGPNNGLVRERSRAIADFILGKGADPLNRVELNGAQVKADPAILADELNSMSLLGGRRVVTLRDAIEKIEPTIKAAFEGAKNMTYLIIEGGDLASSSSLRKLFEKENHFAALPCYMEDAGALEEMIRKNFSDAGLQVTRDAMLYLIANLGNDRAVTNSELQKIALYMGDEKELTLPIAMQLTGDNSAEDMDDLCHSVALGKTTETDKLLRHMLHEGAQPVQIIRALIRYFQRLELALSYMQKGTPREEAIKMLRPPVFYKSVEFIRQALGSWEPNRITYCLNLLLRTEREVKSSILSPALITSNTLVTIQNLKRAA